MEQRDYLEKQIEQLGQVLGKMLNTLLRLQNSGRNSQELEHTQQAFKTELDLDFDALINQPNDAFIDSLKIFQKTDYVNLEKLASIFETLAEKDDLAMQNLLVEKALLLHEYIDTSEATYSLARATKIDTLRKRVKH